MDYLIHKMTTKIQLEQSLMVFLQNELQNSGVTLYMGTMRSKSQILTKNDPKYQYRYTNYPDIVIISIISQFGVFDNTK